MNLKWIVYVLVLGMSVMSAGAETADTTSQQIAESSIQFTFSVEEAVDYATANHPSVLLAMSNVTKNEYFLKEAEDLYKTNRNKNQRSFDMFLVKKGVSFREAQMNYKLAAVNLNTEKNNVKFNVESAYYQHINANEKNLLTQSAYDFASAKYTQTQQQYTQVTASSLDLLVAQNTMKQAKSNFEQSQREASLALTQLKSAIGVPLDCILTLTTKNMPFPALPAVSVEEAVKQAKINNYNVISAKEQLELTQTTFEATGLWYPSNTYKYQQANYQQLHAQNAYTSALYEADIKVHLAYNDVLIAWDSIDILTGTMEVNQKQYEANLQKYELGMITKLELDNSWQALQSAKQQKSDQYYTYLKAMQNYEHSYMQ